MADFLQTTNLYTLSDICFAESKVDLQRYFAANIVVVIPCQVYHLESHLIFQLLNKLKLIAYITEIVVVVNGIPKPLPELVQSLKMIDSRITVLFESGKNSAELSQCLNIQPQALVGKGFALWLGFTYVLQKYSKPVFIATIDADMQNFTSDFLLKLFYPLVQFGAQINKGYYVRYSCDKLDARLTRLLVFPLLHAMRKQESATSASKVIDFLIEFRYPLSGDVAITSSLLSKLSLRAAWSYDLSLLVQVQQQAVDLPIFQTEITDNYQHIHREMASEANHGLIEVAQDIINYLLEFAPFNIQILASDYLRVAFALIDKYAKLADFNGLNFNVLEEQKLARQFVLLLGQNQSSPTILPTWEQVNHQEAVKQFILDLAL